MPTPDPEVRHERLLDLNRSIGHPDRIAMIFGWRIAKNTDAGLKTQNLDHDLGQAVKGRCAALGVRQSSEQKVGISPAPGGRGKV